MSAHVLVAVVGVLCAVVVAVIGVVWRLGTKQGETKAVLDTAAVSIAGLPTAFKELREEIDDHVQMYKSSLDLQNRKITILEAKWETTHRLVEKVAKHDIEIEAIKAVCKERRGQSIKIYARTEDEDEAGTVEAVQAVSCPLEEGDK